MFLHGKKVLSKHAIHILTFLSSFSKEYFNLAVGQKVFFMEYQNLKIEGGTALKGNIVPPSSVSETLFLMSLALLAPGQYRINTTCEAKQLELMANLLNRLGITVSGTRKYFIDLESRLATSTPLDFIDTYNCPAALLLIFPALQAFGEFSIYLPDQPWQPDWFMEEFLSLLTAFGARWELKGGQLTIKAKTLKGARRLVPQKSALLGTMALQAAVLAEGDSQLIGVSQRSEFINCCQALQRMGAMIEGVGSNQLLIQGINALSHQTQQSGPDQQQLLLIFMVTLLTKGSVEFRDLPASSRKLLENIALSLDIPYSVAGKSFLLDNAKFTLPETLFYESPYPSIVLPGLLLLGTLQHHRFNLVSSQLRPFANNLHQLERLGLAINTHGDTISATQFGSLDPTKVMVTNSLNGAWLLLGTLVANGTSYIYNGAVIDQLFSCLDLSLSHLDAKITRFSEE